MTADIFEAPLHNNRTARLEIDDDSLVAYYLDGEAILDEITMVTREREELDGYRLPEETDTDMAAFDAYFEALCTWVAMHTGLAIETLRDAYHPDLNEPYLRYRF